MLSQTTTAATHHNLLVIHINSMRNGIARLKLTHYHSDPLPMPVARRDLTVRAARLVAHPPTP